MKIFSHFVVHLPQFSVHFHSRFVDVVIGGVFLFVAGGVIAGYDVVEEELESHMIREFFISNFPSASLSLCAVLKSVVATEPTFDARSS